MSLVSVMSCKKLSTSLKFKRAKLYTTNSKRLVKTILILLFEESLKSTEEIHTYFKL